MNLYDKAMHAVAQELRFAVRQLRKSPGFTLLVVLTVALGIGANTSVFSMVNGFLRPLPAVAPEQLVVLAAQTTGDDTGLRYRFSFAALRDLRQADCFSDVVAFNVLLAGWTREGKPRQFLHSSVSGDYFSALGLKPAAGRFFLPGEGEQPGVDNLVVLGYTFWQKYFGGNTQAVGSQIRLDGRPTRIIGVAPAGFHGTYGGAEMDGYVPLNQHTAADTPADLNFFTDRDRRPLTVLARLKPAVTVREAQSSMDVLALRLERQYPATDRGVRILVVPETFARPLPLRFVADLIPFVRRLAFILGALVLALACMNVANLLLVRATVREREMALRAALGSGRARLVRQMLVESLLLAVLGATAGLILGKWGSDMSRGAINAATDLPLGLDFHFDWRVFLYALAAAVLTGLVIGIWPALRVSRTAAGAVLNDSARGHSSSIAGRRVRSLLVIGQVAGSLVLLIVAGLFVRALESAQRLKLGFDADHVLNVRLWPQWAGYDRQRTHDFYRDLERRVKAAPGVQSATVAFAVPMGYIFGGTLVFPEGRPVARTEQQPLIGYNAVGPGYFETMRIPILRGRPFTERDNDTAPGVAIVNQTMANRLWPGQDPIGKRFHTLTPESPLLEVVGIVRDSKYLAVFEGPLPYFYAPSEQHPGFLRVLQVRSSMPAESLLRVVEREIRALDPEMPTTEIQTMRQALGTAGGFMLFRVGAMQAGAMGGLGLVLAVIGVYGVVSYGASQRTREIGIRMALGARPRDVLFMILRQGVMLVAAGVATGLVAAAALTRAMARFVPLTNTTDIGTFVAVTGVLGFIALWACYLPAHSAMRVDPIAALRHE